MCLRCQSKLQTFVDYLIQMSIIFFQLSIKIVDYFIPVNKENGLLYLPGEGIPLNSDIKLNNRSKYQICLSGVN